MKTSKELFLALLSMDAYNRGYGAGIADGDANDPDGLGESGFVGNARILARGDGVDYEAWQDAGFYAVAYEVEAGAWEGLAEDTTVISFRGTDRAFGWTGSDAWNGWGIGAGAFAGDQARLGQAFFQAVTGTTDGEARAGNALLTGHSLGGGSVLGG